MIAKTVGLPVYEQVLYDEGAMDIAADITVTRSE